MINSDYCPKAKPSGRKRTTRKKNGVRLAKSRTKSPRSFSMSNLRGVSLADFFEGVKGGGKECVLVFPVLIFK